MEDKTFCVHHPDVSHEGFASLTVPTYRASTIVFKDAQAYATRGQRGPDGYSYGLHGTPTTKTLEAQLNQLHRGAASVLLPSGQCAIAVTMLTALKPGDWVLVPETAYPPVLGFCRNFLAPLGISHTVYDPLVGAGIADLMSETVKLVWLESPGSTTMEVQDFAAIAAVAHDHGALVGCDNTYASPLLFKPLDHGADFAMEALTKWFSGHSDLLLGSVTVRDPELRLRLRDQMRMMGLGVSPDEAALVLRGMQTMAVRLSHSATIAERFARKMEPLFPAGSILHPALPSCPGHAFFKRDFAGPAGLFSVVLPEHSLPRLDAALDGLQVFRIGASWGGTSSLMAPMSVKGQRRLGATFDDTIILRLSIGMEDPDDLWADIERLTNTLQPMSEALQTVPE